MTLPYEDLISLARPGMLTSPMGIVDKTAYMVNTAPIDTTSLGSNIALFVKLWNPRAFRSTHMAYMAGTTGGDNVDVGLYRLNGSAPLVRLGASGSVAVTAGVHSKRIPLVVDVPEGEVILAFVLSGSLAQFQRQDIATFEDYAHLWGWGQMPSAFPLPALATPVAATGISLGPPILSIYDQVWS